MEKGIFNDENGISTIVEYILTLVISMFIFSIFLTSFNTFFLDSPVRTVCKNQFNDIGNDIGTKLIDTYLVTPENGSISTSFDIPDQVTGKTYSVRIQTKSSNEYDKEITVFSEDTDVAVSLTLNGVSTTIPINGSTNSTSPTHIVDYKS